VPPEVITTARAYMAELEAAHRAFDGNPQTELPFAAAEAPARPSAIEEARPGAVEEAVSAVDPDTLSPREALELLYRLKTLL
jgi:DNA mismatch repair protein MutS